MQRHSYEMRRHAADLIEEGHSFRAIANELAISKSIARKWVHTYRSVGREVFLGMGSSHKKYDFETKLAAVIDYTEGGLTRQEVMSKYGIASLDPLLKWAQKYREGGPDALRPKPKGRPRSAEGGEPRPKSREAELEEENRRLRAENAYLKKLRALEAERRAPGRNARRYASFQGRDTGSRTCWRPRG